MALAEKVSEMKNQGAGEEEIAKNLQEGGFSPKEINEAIEQSNIKSAISFPSPASPQGLEQPQQNSSNQAPPELTSAYQDIPSPQNFPQQNEAYQTFPQSQMQSIPPMQQPLTQEFQETYPQDYSGYGGDYAQAEYSDTNTISEIAEQVTEEKLEKIRKQLTETIKFKTEAEGRIINLNNRLKRIEMILDKLQTSIIGKIGEYGQNISDLKKEMILTQDSFSKVLEKDNELEKLKGIAETKTKKKTRGKRGRKKKEEHSFAKYLR